MAEQQSRPSEERDSQQSSKSEEDAFTRFEPAKHGHPRRREGFFARIHGSNSSDTLQRKIYLSADALDYLDWPEYIVYYIDKENRRVAIEKASAGTPEAYSVTDHSTAVEMVLRVLDVPEATMDRRLALERNDDQQWLILDFLGGIDDARPDGDDQP